MNKGLLLGHAELGKPSLLKAAVALFDPYVSSRAAVNRFVDALPFTPKRHGRIHLTNGLPHSSVYSQTGGGKNQSQILPFLKQCSEPVILLETKGENHRTLGRYREKTFGRRQVVLDPMGVTGVKSDTFNPLWAIDPEDPACIDHCQALAEMLVKRNPHSKDEHWDDSAVRKIGGFSLAVVLDCQGDLRSLQTVRTIVANPALHAKAIAYLCASTAFNGIVSRIGHQLASYVGNEGASVNTVTARHLSFLDTVKVYENTRTSSFDPNDIRGGNMDIYCCLPPEFHATHSGLLRLWLGWFLRSVIAQGPSEKQLVHVVLDEAAPLGNLAEIATALQIGRGYGLRLQLYYQDRGQLAKCWPDGADRTLLANTNQLYGPTNDYEQAEAISKHIGEHTISVENWGGNTGRSRSWHDDGRPGNVSGSSGENWGSQQHGRAVIRPEEILTQDPRTLLTLIPGKPAIRTRMIRYHEDSTLGEPTADQRLRANLRLFGWALLFFAAMTMLAGLVVGAAERKAFYHPPERRVRF